MEIKSPYADYHKDQKAKNTYLLSDYVFTLEESDTFN